MPRFQQLPVPLGLKLYPTIIQSLGYDPCKWEFHFSIYRKTPTNPPFKSANVLWKKSKDAISLIEKVTLFSSKIFKFFFLIYCSNVSFLKVLVTTVIYVSYDVIILKSVLGNLSFERLSSFLSTNIGLVKYTHSDKCLEIYLVNYCCKNVVIH